jgi:hypothetical protein
MLRERQLDGTIYDKTTIAIDRIKTMAPIAERIYGGYTVCSIPPFSKKGRHGNRALDESLHTFITLTGFKIILGVDEREKALSRYCFLR